MITRTTLKIEGQHYAVRFKHDEDTQADPFILRLIFLLDLADETQRNKEIENHLKTNGSLSNWQQEQLKKYELLTIRHINKVNKFNHEVTVEHGE